MTDAPRLRLAHLYPDVMNVYGDRGNVIALRHRCRARGITLDVSGPGIGDEFDPHECDLLVIGGGEDREQRRVAPDLAARGPAIRAAIEDGLPALAASSSSRSAKAWKPMTTRSARSSRSRSAAKSTCGPFSEWGTAHVPRMERGGADRAAPPRRGSGAPPRDGGAMRA